MKFTRAVRKLHKITATLVGIQLLLWMVSGLYMTAVPIDIVRGQHLVDKPASQPLNALGILPIDSLSRQYPDTTKIELTKLREQLVYRLTGKNGTLYLYGTTGEPLPPLTEIEAIDIATSVYLGEGNIANVRWITKGNAPAELGSRPLPVWQITYDDLFESTVYISGFSGDVSAVRSNIWRVFDFLWMLHIMDYEDRSDFNNPLVILASSIGCFIVLSGLLMLINSMRQKGWRSLS
ncbi:MAG: hypothetical protein MK214_12165 [Thalassotalea sp.]|nr:hypothetical protein [Thalassotalea sp.]